MNSAIDKLLSLASEPIGARVGPSSALLDRDPLGGELLGILAQINGFYAFESALHVFPLGHSTEEVHLDSWNEPSLWRDEYRGMADDYVFFAEDAFGGQFGLKNGQVFCFEPETGEAVVMARSLEGWARSTLDDLEVLTGYPVARDWQFANGPIPSGCRLIPKRPFVLGGEYSPSNLYAVSAVDGMRFRADIAVQIRDLPDGTPIALKSVD